MIRPLLYPALVLIAAASALPGQARERGGWQSRIDTTLAFDRRGTVALSLAGGEIVVNAWDRPQVRVRARSERGELRMDATSGRLTLDLTRTRSGETTYEVTVPTGVHVSARATSGDVSVSGTKGSVEVRTQSGDIAVADAAARVELRSLSGDVTARNLTGVIEAHSLSGDIELAGVSGEVDVTSVSSDIELRDVSARYVRARSTSGDITYDGAVDGSGRYELGSHSGSVYLLVPQGTGALLTVSTYSGSIDSEFPITLKPGDFGLGHSRRYSFEVGKGDARISAESFSGDITIRIRGRSGTDR